MKIIFTSLFILSVYFSNAQYNFVNAKIQTQVLTSRDEFFDIENSIKNQSLTDSLFLNWDVQVDSPAQGWAPLSICDNKDCYFGLMSGTFFIRPDKTGLFNVKPDHASVNGKMKMTVNFTDAKGSKPIQSLVYTFILKDTTKVPGVGISNIQKQSEFFTQNESTITLNEIAADMNISVSDLNGKAIVFDRMNNKMDLSTYRNQMLFISLSDDKSKNTFKILVP
jgi:hypothetical protein